jgi:WD40 repeat protein
MTDQLLELHWQGQLQDYITTIAPGVDRWAASSAAGEVVCWQQGELYYYQQANQSAINCLSYGSDGQYLAAGGQNGQVQVWRDDQPWHQFSNSRVWIDRLAWHPHLPVLAVAVGKQVQIWEIEHRQLLATLPFDRSSVFDLGWHPSGHQIAVAGYGGVAVWQWDKWQEYELFQVETSAHLLAWSQDYLAVATLDRQLLIAAIDELERPWIIGDIPTKIRQLQWFNTEPKLVVNSSELICWQYNEETWQAVTGTGGQVMALHPQLLLIAQSALDGSILLQNTDLMAMEQVACPPGVALQWSRDGETLLLGTAEGSLQSWTIKD